MAHRRFIRAGWLSMALLCALTAPARALADQASSADREWTVAADIGPGRRIGTASLQLVMGAGGSVIGFLPGLVIGAMPGLAITDDGWSAPTVYGAVAGGLAGAAVVSTGGVWLAGRIFGRRAPFGLTLASSAIGTVAVGGTAAALPIDKTFILAGGLAGGVVGAIVGWHVFEEPASLAGSTASSWTPAIAPRLSADGRLAGADVLVTVWGW